jgi:hypothetical protein
MSRAIVNVIIVAGAITAAGAAFVFLKPAPTAPISMRVDQKELVAPPIAPYVAPELKAAPAMTPAIKPIDTGDGQKPAPVAKKHEPSHVKVTAKVVHPKVVTVAKKHEAPAHVAAPAAAPVDDDAQILRDMAKGK